MKKDAREDHHRRRLADRVRMVDQHYLTVEPWDKRALLLHLLTAREAGHDGRVLPHQDDRPQASAKYLREKGINVPGRSTATCTRPSATA